MASPVYSTGRSILASPIAGAREEIERLPLEKASRTPFDSSLVNSDARFTADSNLCRLIVIFLSESFGITSLYGGNVPSTKAHESVAPTPPASDDTCTNSLFSLNCRE